MAVFLVVGTSAGRGSFFSRGSGLLRKGKAVSETFKIAAKAHLFTKVGITAGSSDQPPVFAEAETTASFFGVPLPLPFCFC